MSDQVFVQSVRLRLKTKDGQVIESKFTGLAMCSPEQWEEIKDMSLGQAMNTTNPIQISDPKLIDDLVTEDSDYHDVIDSVRDELRSAHHEKLKE